jgi:hypothetical protein
MAARAEGVWSVRVLRHVSAAARGCAILVQRKGVESATVGSSRLRSVVKDPDDLKVLLAGELLSTRTYSNIPIPWTAK